MTFERTIPYLNVSEKFFIEICSVFMLAFGLTVGYQIVIKGKRIDYGRYAQNPKSILGIVVPGSFVTLIIACPSFFVPIYALFKRGFNIPLVNLSIVLMFIGHYFQRYAFLVSCKIKPKYENKKSV